MVLPVVAYSEVTRATGVAAEHWKTDRFACHSDGLHQFDPCAIRIIQIDLTLSIPFRFGVLRVAGLVSRLAAKSTRVISFAVELPATQSHRYNLAQCQAGHL